MVNSDLGVLKRDSKDEVIAFGMTSGMVKSEK
jgi:hypothetical protein